MAASEAGWLLGSVNAPFENRGDRHWALMILPKKDVLHEGQPVFMSLCPVVLMSKDYVQNI